jgi:hypothetical protein
MMFSFKFIAAIIIGIVLLIYVAFAYFNNIAKAKAARKLAEQIEKQPRLAQEIADKLTSVLVEIDFDFNLIYNKLLNLTYELEFFHHRIYKCHPLSDTSFVLITTYEYLDTASNNSVEKYFILNYKIELDKQLNKVRILSDNESNELQNQFKASFIKEFFKRHINK